MLCNLRVAILDDYQNVAFHVADWSVLREMADIVTFNTPFHSEEQLVATLQPFDVLVAMRERTVFCGSVLRALSKLRLIVTTGMENASIDLAVAKQRGITVCGTGGMLEPIVEFTWGVILALARHIPHEDRAIRSGAWQTRLGKDLSGQTLGLLGLGRVGAGVCRISKAFGMSVIAWSQNLSRDRASVIGARLVARDELFSTADVLSIHLRLSARTTQLVTCDDLKRMKPTALLVNTSRAAIIDLKALELVLRAKRIAGAALDVHEFEPLPASNPFLKLDNVILTPHCAYVTEGTYARFYADAIEDIERYCSGRPVRLLSVPIDQRSTKLSE